MKRVLSRGSVCALRSVVVALVCACICLAGGPKVNPGGGATVGCGSGGGCGGSVPAIQSDQLGDYVNGTDYVEVGIASSQLIVDTNTSNFLPIRTVKIDFSNLVSGSAPLSTGQYDIRLVVDVPVALFANTPVIVPTKIIIAPINKVQYSLVFSNIQLTWNGLSQWTLQSLTGSVAQLQSVLLKGKSSPVNEGSFSMPFQLGFNLNQ